MNKVLVTGGSGLVGTRLTAFLLERGYTTVHVGRVKRNGPVPSFTWDVSQNQMDSGTFHGIDTIVHLAGAGIADKRWTYSRKLEILESRVNSTRLLYNELEKGMHNVSTVISSSAIGYYGFEDREVPYTEDSQPGSDFLATVTTRWEAEVDRIASLGIRVVKIRTGIVLSKEGGALKEISRPVRYLVGAPLGSGKQSMSWIHIDDLCGMYLTAIVDQSINGVFNAVSPTPVSNEDFTKAIAKTLGRPLLLPFVPNVLLRLVLGEMADLVLHGTKVSAQKMLSAGYKFKFPNLEMALHDLLSDTPAAVN